MKGQRKQRLQKAEAQEARWAMRLLLAGLALVGLIAWAGIAMQPMASPTRMVAAQVVHERRSVPFKAIPMQNAFTDSTSKKYPDYLPLTFANLSSFPFSVTEDMIEPKSDSAGVASNTLQQIPQSIRSFSGKKIAVTGFMLPVRTEGNFATEFLILKDRSACCYGLTPRVNEWIIVHAKGRSAKSVLDVPVTALGTFHVGEQRENGALAAIYELDCDRLINPDK
jgi:hypothetical protein